MRRGDNLGDRMKEHELTSHHVLIKRVPVIIRVDGRAFHTLTQGMIKPNDNAMIAAKGWRIDSEIPTFTQDRDYIKNRL